MTRARRRMHRRHRQREAAIVAIVHERVRRLVDAAPLDRIDIRNVDRRGNSLSFDVVHTRYQPRISLVLTVK